MFKLSPTACYLTLTLTLLVVAPSSHAQTSPTLEEVVISAVLMTSDANRVSASTVGRVESAQRGAAHFEDLLTILPNVNASSGASRQRFFQIRGIGERSQFIEPINPSVVILQDGVDLSGLGSALTTFDVAGMTVLRGPQGSLMGAGALAGLIDVTSTAPADRTEATIGLGIENDNGRRANITVSTALTDALSVRIAHQNYRSDGWVKNTFLGVSDTNRRDERTSRLALRHDGGNNVIEAGVNHLDIANGYDAFSLDNTRQTLSDQPGEDSLDLTSGFIRWRYNGSTVGSKLQLSHVEADSLYSYDEDWSYVGIRPFWEYSSFDAYARDVDRTTIEWRISPAASAEIDWIVGIYGREDSETLGRTYTYLTSPFASSNTTDTWAAFGQLSTALRPDISFTVGGRLEHRDLKYRDSAAVDEQFSDHYWTGKASIEWQINTEQSVYATIARGVRGGGVNASLSSTLLALAEENDVAAYTSRTRFDEEELLSTELGWRLRSADDTLRASLAIFSMDRNDQQVKGSLVIPRADGSTSFTDFTDNAATGTNRGLELTVDWQASEKLTLNLAVGSLDAHFDEYINVDGVRLSGRDQPQAPSWQYRLSVTWKLTSRLTGSLESTVRDTFYLSDRHNFRSPRAEIINAHLMWEGSSWIVSVWGRNLTDELTVTRGFGTFGNDPRKDYALEPYYQFGEPRTVGATLSYRFGE